MPNLNSLLDSKHLPIFEFQAGSFTLELSQNDSSGSHGTTVWNAAKALATYLFKTYNGNLKGKRVLELGAGCGLAGLMASCMGTATILTDREDVLWILRDNAARNKATLNGNVLVEELDWLKGIDESSSTFSMLPFDIVLGADTIYCSELIQPFLSIVEKSVSSKSVIYIALERRDSMVVEDFVRKAKIKFDVSSIKKIPPPFRQVDIEIYKLKLKNNVSNLVANSCE